MGNKIINIVAAFIAFCLAIPVLAMMLLCTIEGWVMAFLIFLIIMAIRH